MTQATHATHQVQGRSLITQPKHLFESLEFVSREGGGQGTRAGAKVRFAEDERRDISTEQHLTQQTESARIGLGNFHAGVTISESDTRDAATIQGQDLIRRSKSKSLEVDIGKIHADITVTKSHAEKDQREGDGSPVQFGARGVQGVEKSPGVTVSPGGEPSTQTIQPETLMHQSSQVQGLEGNGAKRPSLTFEEFRASGAGESRVRFAGSESQVEDNRWNGGVRQELCSKLTQKSESAEINIGRLHAGVTKSRVEQSQNQCQDITSKEVFTSEGKVLGVTTLPGGSSESQTRITATHEICSPRITGTQPHTCRNVRHPRDGTVSPSRPTCQPNPLCDLGKDKRSINPNPSPSVGIPPRVLSPPGPCSPVAASPRIMPSHSHSPSALPYHPRSPVVESPRPIFRSPPRPPPFVVRPPLTSPNTVPRQLSSPSPPHETVTFDLKGARGTLYRDGPSDHDGSYTGGASISEGVKRAEGPKVAIVDDVRVTNGDTRITNVSSINVTETADKSETGTHTRRNLSCNSPCSPSTPADVRRGYVTGQIMGESAQQINQSSIQQTIQITTERDTKSSSKRVTFTESSGQYGDQGVKEVLDITFLPGGKTIQEPVTDRETKVSTHELRSLTQETTEPSNFEIGKSNNSVSLAESVARSGSRDTRKVVDVAVLPGGTSVMKSVAVQGMQGSRQELGSSMQQTTERSVEVDIGKSSHSVSLSESSGQHGAQGVEEVLDVTILPGRETLQQGIPAGGELNTEQKSRESMDQELAHQESDQILAQSSPQPAPQSLSEQIGSATLAIAEQYAAATEPTPLGGLIKDAVVKLAENALENYAGVPERNVAGTQFPPGEQDQGTGALEESSSSKMIEQTMAEEAQENISSTQEAVKMAKEASSEKEIAWVATEAVRVNTSSSPETLQTGTDTVQEGNSLSKGNVQTGTDTVQAVTLSSQNILQTATESAQEHDSSPKEFVQKATDSVQENTSSSQELLKTSTDSAKERDSSNVVVQKETKAVQEDTSSPQKILQTVTATESSQENGGFSPRGIVQTATRAEQENISSSEETLQKTTEVAQEHDLSRESAQMMIQQPSTTVETTAYAAVAETDSAGVGLSSATVPSSVQNVSGSKIQASMERATVDSEAIALDNMNVPEAPGSTETTGVTVQNGTLMHAGDITTELRNPEVKSAMVQEIIGYDVTSEERSIQTVKKTSVSMGTNSTEVSNPSATPATAPVKRNTISNLLPGALGVSGASRKFLKASRTLSSDKSSDKSIEKSNEKSSSEASNKVVTFSLTHDIVC